jgi:hypothetical protein
VIRRGTGVDRKASLYREILRTPLIVKLPSPALEAKAKSATSQM